MSDDPDETKSSSVAAANSAGSNAGAKQSQTLSERGKNGSDMTSGDK